MGSQTNKEKSADLTSQGFELMKKGEYEKALKLFYAAADLYALDNDFKNQSIQFQAISEIYRLTDKIDEALEICEKLLQIYTRTEEYEQVFRVLNNMGLLEVGRKNYDRALERFRSALELSENLNNKKYEALQTGNIGSTYRDMNESVQAIEYYEKAFSLYEESGHREGAADQYTNIAYIHVVEKRIEKALELYQKALLLYIDIENTEKAQFTKQNIGRLKAALKESQV